MNASIQGFTGTVSLQLSDLIQMVCLSRSDMVIRVRSSAKGSGIIHIREGRIHHVQTETLQGEEAFFEVLRWQDGQFEMLPSEPADIKTIDKPWEHMLLEATRRRDEGVREAKSEESHGNFEMEHSEDPSLDELDDRIDSVFDSLEMTARDMAPEEAVDTAGASAPEPNRTIKVLIVDDSSFFSKQLKRMLEADPDIQVVASARNGKEALDYLSANPPVNLITLDIQMPVMQGDTALKHIMLRHPVPTLIISTLQPQALRKVMEFLQVGAIDFISKPAVNESVELYGEELRGLAKRTARADVSHFRRWRKLREEPVPPVAKKELPSGRTLLVVGAEGAYMDWFRLPLPKLCRRGLVVGLQKLSEPYLAHFCQLLEEGTGARIVPLVRSERLSSGSFCLGNAARRVRLELRKDDMSLCIGELSSESISWEEGMAMWLCQLSKQAGESLSIYFLSASHRLDPQVTERVLSCGSQLILAPREAVMCTDLIDSIQPYSITHPQQVLRRSPESLVEVFRK